MAFTALDASSVSQLLHRWEVGEYISEAFVILGCAGELVADLATCISRRKRRHIERWSTILLVLALSIGLKCLIRTNELSGIVIGSLGDRADEADKKAKAAISDSSTALSQAKDALDKAGKAQESLGRAEREAKQAQSAALSALNLARTARNETDLAMRDIALAQKRVVEIGSMINILAKKTALRALDREQCVQMLKGIPKGTAEIWYEPNDIDVSMFAAQIYECLGPQGAGWVVTNIRPLPEKWESSLMGQASRLNDARISASETGIAVSGRINNSPPASPVTDPWSVLERAVNANGTVSVFSSEKIEDPSLPEGHFVIVVGHQQGSNVALPTPSWQLENPRSSAPQQK